MIEKDSKEAERFSMDVCHMAYNRFSSTVGFGFYGWGFYRYAEKSYTKP